MAEDLRDLDPFDVTSSVYFDQGMRKLVDPPEPPPLYSRHFHEGPASVSPWLVAMAVLAFSCLVVSSDSTAHWAWRAGAIAALLLTLAVAGGLWLRRTIFRGPSGRADSGGPSRRH